MTNTSVDYNKLLGDMLQLEQSIILQRCKTICNIKIASQYHLPF